MNIFQDNPELFESLSPNEAKEWGCYFAFTHYQAQSSEDKNPDGLEVVSKKRHPSDH